MLSSPAVRCGATSKLTLRQCYRSWSQLRTTLLSIKLRTPAAYGRQPIFANAARPLPQRDLSEPRAGESRESKGGSGPEGCHRRDSGCKDAVWIARRPLDLMHFVAASRLYLISTSSLSRSKVS
jgi:hypothetical protein